VVKVTGLLVLSMAVVVSVCGCQAGPPEVSTPQEWAFEAEKVWEIHQVGDDELLRPAEPRVADDGTLFIHDFERHVSYIVDKDGNPVGPFASRGSNEGEVPFYINCFPAGNHVVVGAMDMLHFFTSQGQFVKAVPNNLFVRFPLAFKNENEFWVAPGALGDSQDSLAVITQVNLISGEETTAHEFALVGDERQPTGGAVVLGLTPQVKMAFDSQSDRIYFGKNSDTIIYWRTADGSEAGSFSFTGEQRPVSETDKRNHFAKFDIPEDRVAAIVDVLPDRMTHYHRIRIINGLVYLFSAENIAHHHSGQIVDVYSPDGRHLYHGQVQVEEGWYVASPDNLQLVDGFVYAVQENDEGDKKIVKYNVTMPQ
jgi:hypothetical protein